MSVGTLGNCPMSLARTHNLHNEHKTRGAQCIITKTKDHCNPEILQQILETQCHPMYNDL